MLTIDHIVLTVEDINKTISFYTDILGMDLVDFTPIGASKPRFALQFGNQKINIHQAQLPFKPHAKNPTCGSVDICFLSDVSIYFWIETFKKHSIIIEGWGMWSISFSVFKRSRWKFNRNSKPELNPSNRTII